MDIKEVREKYPQYKDLSDVELATALHKKYYSDIPFQDFSKRIGLQEPSAERKLPTLGEVGGKIGGFAKEAIFPETPRNVLPQLPAPAPRPTGVISPFHAAKQKEDVQKEALHQKSLAKMKAEGWTPTTEPGLERSPDLVDAALMYGIPAYVGGGTLARIGTGALLGGAYETAQDLMSGKNPQLGEVATGAAFGGAIGGASKPIGWAFGKLAKAFKKPKAQVFKEVSEEAASRGVGIEDVLNEKLTGGKIAETLPEVLPEAPKPKPKPKTPSLIDTGEVEIAFRKTSGEIITAPGVKSHAQATLSEKEIDDLESTGFLIKRTGQYAKSGDEIVELLGKQAPEAPAPMKLYHGTATKQPLTKETLQPSSDVLFEGVFATPSRELAEDYSKFPGKMDVARRQLSKQQTKQIPPGQIVEFDYAPKKILSVRDFDEYEQGVVYGLRQTKPELFSFLKQNNFVDASGKIINPDEISIHLSEASLSVPERRKAFMRFVQDEGYDAIDNRLYGKEVQEIILVKPEAPAPPVAKSPVDKMVEAEAKVEIIDNELEQLTSRLNEIEPKINRGLEVEDAILEREIRTGKTFEGETPLKPGQAGFRGQRRKGFGKMLAKQKPLIEEVEGIYKRAEELIAERKNTLKNFIPEEQIETPSRFRRLLGEEAGLAGEGKPIPEKGLTEEAKETVSGTAEKLLTETGEPIPKYTGKTINLERFETEDEIKNFINNLAKEIPDASIPNETIALNTLREMAENDFGIPYKQWAKNIKEGELLAKDIRQLTKKTIVARDAALTASEDTFARAKAITEGANSDVDVAEFISSLQRSSLLLKEAGGAASEFGRGLGALRIGAKSAKAKQKLFEFLWEKFSKGQVEEIAKNLAKLDPNNPQQIFAFIRGSAEATFRDKLFELRINALLSGPQTHIVNFESNGLVAMMRELERPVSATIEAVVAPIQGRPREIFFGETPHALYGIWQGMKEGVMAGMEAFKTEVPQFGVDATKIEMPRFRVGGAIKGRFGKTIRVPSRLLMASDEYFKTIALRMEQNALAFKQASKEGLEGMAKAKRIAELKSTPTEYMKGRARGEAVYRTFQQELGKGGKGIAKLRRDVPGLEHLIVFLRTPINIVKFGLERTPLNLLRLMGKQSKFVQKLTGTSPLQGAEVSEEMAKALTGSLLAYTVYRAAEEGHITGSGPTDLTERRIKYATGWKPYAVRLPNRMLAPVGLADTSEGHTYLQYGRFEPFGMIFGLAADFYELASQVDPSDYWKKVGSTVAQNIGNKTWTKGIADALAAIYDPDRYGDKFMESFIGSFIPTGAAHLAKGFDPTLRQVEGITEAMKSRIPFMSRELRPIYDIWGRPILSAEPGWMRTLSPVRVGRYDPDPATLEVQRLGITVGMGVMKDEILMLNVKVPLTDDEYDMYVRESGQMAHDAVNKLVQSPSYPMMPDMVKINLIEKLVTNSRKFVAAKVRAAVWNRKKDFIKANYRQALIGARQNQNPEEQMRIHQNAAARGMQLK